MSNIKYNNKTMQFTFTSRKKPHQQQSLMSWAFAESPHIQLNSITVSVDELIYCTIKYLSCLQIRTFEWSSTNVRELRSLRETKKKRKTCFNSLKLHKPQTYTYSKHKCVRSLALYVQCASILKKTHINQVW